MKNLKPIWLAIASLLLGAAAAITAQEIEVPLEAKEHSLIKITVTNPEKSPISIRVRKNLATEIEVAELKDGSFVFAAASGTYTVELAFATGTAIEFVSKAIQVGENFIPPDPIPDPEVIPDLPEVSLEIWKAGKGQFTKPQLDQLSNLFRAQAGAVQTKNISLQDAEKTTSASFKKIMGKEYEGRFMTWFRDYLGEEREFERQEFIDFWIEIADGFEALK